MFIEGHVITKPALYHNRKSFGGKESKEVENGLDHINKLTKHMVFCLQNSSNAA